MVRDVNFYPMETLLSFPTKNLHEWVPARRSTKHETLSLITHVSMSLSHVVTQCHSAFSKSVWTDVHPWAFVSCPGNYSERPSACHSHVRSDFLRVHPGGGLTGHRGRTGDPGPLERAVLSRTPTTARVMAIAPHLGVLRMTGNMSGSFDKCALSKYPLKRLHLKTGPSCV